MRDYAAGGGRAGLACSSLAARVGVRAVGTLAENQQLRENVAHTATDRSGPTVVDDAAANPFCRTPGCTGSLPMLAAASLGLAT